MDGKGFTLGKGIEGNRQRGRNAVHGVGVGGGESKKEERERKEREKRERGEKRKMCEEGKEEIGEERGTR
jgi:hypothetical protein